MSARGGFKFPQVYEQSQDFVIEALKRGEVEYADLSQWSFPDEFLCFVLQSKLFEYMDRTYPSPRERHDVPVWFLLSCQFLLRLHGSGRYHQLNYFLNAGSVLTRVGFNVRSGSIGFNQKNRYERHTAVDADTVRKFFKDTKPNEIRNWYNEELQRWFKGQRSFDEKGLFILDQTHLVVPDNPNYKGAVRMPVDEHGQWYKNFSYLSEEQKKALPYHPCYSLSYLLHINKKGDLFHVAGYEFGPGSEDELIQADRLVPKFCEAHPSAMKELFMDRGYIDGDFVGKMKKDYGVDVLVPLKKNMSSYQDAVGIAQRENKWEILEQETDNQGKSRTLSAAFVAEMDLWQSCPVKQHATVCKEKTWNKETQRYEESIWVLGATKRYLQISTPFRRYQLRTQIEERNRQLKEGWQIGKFTSPHPGLMESQLCFTMFTYSLLQLYLRRKDLQNHTQRMIQTLRREEQLGKNVVLVYAENSFGVMDLRDYSVTLVDLDEKPKEKLKTMFQLQKEAALKKAAATV